MSDCGVAATVSRSQILPVTSVLVCGIQTAASEAVAARPKVRNDSSAAVPMVKPVLKVIEADWASPW